MRWREGGGEEEKEKGKFKTDKVKLKKRNSNSLSNPRSSGFEYHKALMSENEK